MSLLDEIRGVVEAVQGDAELNAVRFPLSATWSDGTSNRFNVRDPHRGDSRQGFTRMQTDPIPASLRLVRFHPTDPEPALGSGLDYQGGQLVLGLWGDSSNWTGQRVGVCRLVDDRAYPLVATIGTRGFRLRITALNATAATASDLSLDRNDSHRGHLPPGVHLTPGEVITTDTGDQYQVVPPVQRDGLGDVVGLSWQGRAEDRAPSAGNDPTPLPAPSPQPPVPSGYDPAWDDPV